MIKVECSNCHNHFFTPPKAAGKSGKCPSCGEIIVVPIPGESSSAINHDAPSAPRAPKTNRESAGPSSNGSHGNRTSRPNDSRPNESRPHVHRPQESRPGNDANGAAASKGEPQEEKTRLKKTIDWLKEIFELEKD